tara:strand:- start:18 stop:488 length:471 start_codon:yes stop_codon:yes gene_type:complete
MDFNYYYNYYTNITNLDLDISLHLAKYVSDILRIKYDFVYNKKLIIKKKNENNGWDILNDKNKIKDIYIYFHFDLFYKLLEELQKLGNDPVLLRSDDIDVDNEDDDINNNNENDIKMKIISNILLIIKNKLNTYDKIKDIIKDITILEKYKYKSKL